MFIKRKFRNRHKILEALQIQYNKNHLPDALSVDMELSWGKLTEACGLNDKEVLEQIDFLLISDEIYNNEIDYNSSYLILQKGTTAFYDKKYPNMGIKEFKDDLYDILKLVSGFVLLLITIITFTKNIMTTERNSREIQNLKMDVQNLKSSMPKVVSNNKTLKPIK